MKDYTKTIICSDIKWTDILDEEKLPVEYEIEVPLDMFDEELENYIKEMSTDDLSSIGTMESFDMEMEKCEVCPYYLKGEVCPYYLFVIENMRSKYEE